MRIHKGHKLKQLSDYEWLNLVPDEMLDVYLHFSKYSVDELDESMKRYPEWWVEQTDK